MRWRIIKLKNNYELKTSSSVIKFEHFVRQIMYRYQGVLRGNILDFTIIQFDPRKDEKMLVSLLQILRH